MTYFKSPNGGIHSSDGLTDKAFLKYCPSGTVKIADRPSNDHQWIDGAWALLDLATLQIEAVEQVKTRHAEMLVKLSGDYSSEERETWLLQLEWARGFIADQNTAHAVFLSGMFPTSPTGNMVDDAQLMADKIVGKSTAYAKLVMLAQRTKALALAAIAAVETPEQLTTTMADLVDAETAAIAELAKDTK